MTRKLLVPLDHGGNKGTNVANGTAPTDVAAFGQIPVIDGTASDIKAPAITAAAGTSTKAPAADHVHPLQDPLAIGQAQTFVPNASMAAQAAVANAAWYYRLVSGGYAITTIQVAVATSSGNICVAAYAATGWPGTTAKPGTQYQTSGSVACPASGASTVALGAGCTPNLNDWLAIGIDNATATLYGTNGATSGIVQGCTYEQTGLTGAVLPGTAGTLVNTSARIFYLRGL